MFCSEYNENKKKYVLLKSQNDFPAESSLIGGSKRNMNLVNKILNILNENYIYPKNINKLQNVIHEKKNEYENKKDEMDVINLMYDDIQLTLNDKHIRFFPNKKEKHHSQTQKNKRSQNIDINFSDYLRTEWLNTQIYDKNIGIVKFNGFPWNNDSNIKDIIMSTVINAYWKIRNCDKIIFDLRDNGGGNPHTVQFMQSFLFKKKTLLNKLCWRMKGTSKENVQKFYTFTENELKEDTKTNELPTLYDNKVFVLVSPKTFSAAEEFTYNLSTRKRAIIIGKTTKGGANPGRIFVINPRHKIFIPTGRANNPITKTNWEGVGISPDIQIDSSLSMDKILEILIDFE